MTTLNDLLPELLGRLEETVVPADGGVPGPIFWSLQNELYPELVDGMFEAALITGVVQAVNIKVTLQPLINYFSLSAGQGFGYEGFGFGDASVSGLLGGVIAALRMRAPWTIRKTSLKGLSDIVPDWETEDPGVQIKAWFPLGVSAFGIWPQLSVESEVVMDFLVSPVNQPRPYSPTINVPFQEEFTDAFSMYAAVMLRAKELGNETEESELIMNEWIQKMKDLSIYQNRLDSLVKTQSSGAMAETYLRTVL